MDQSTLKPLCAYDGCHRFVEARGYCKRHYVRLLSRGELQVLHRPTPAERFWALVQKTDSCWLWMGFLTAAGHGSSKVLGKYTTAHRVAWELTHGPISPFGPRMEVAHNCPGGDNPRCVNPAHLMLLTREEHVQDTVKKGQYPKGERNGHATRPERTPRGDTHPAHLHPERMARGERVANAKLTAAQVSELRRRYERGGISQENLGREYGIGQNAVSSIILRRTWKHID